MSPRSVIDFEPGFCLVCAEGARLFSRSVGTSDQGLLHTHRALVTGTIPGINDYYHYFYS